MMAKDGTGSKKVEFAYVILIFKGEGGEVSGPQSGELVQERLGISIDSLQTSRAGLTSFIRRVLIWIDQRKVVGREY